MAVTLAQRLADGLTYHGETPFGSCVQQALCNVLEAQGLTRAASLIGLSWGFGFDRTDGKLRGAERWSASVAELSGLEITHAAPRSLVAARQAERAVLAEPNPLVAVVDSFYIDSPYRDRQHLRHALIVLERGRDHVVVIDPMNAPRPTHLPAARYDQARAGTGVRSFDMIVSRGRVAAPYSAFAALAALRADLLATWDAGVAELDAFTSAVQAGEVAADVADVAAERLYVQRLLEAASAMSSVCAALAAALEALSRRWYLVHTVALADGGSARRMAAFLRDLKARELAAREQFLAATDNIGPAAAAAPPYLMAQVRAALSKLTAIDMRARGDEDDLWAAGLTSLESVRVLIDIEEKLGFEFPPSMLSRGMFSSVAAIGAVVVAALAVRTADSAGATR